MRAFYTATARSMRTNKGFTLIELLVVIAIIAILAGIAIPQFNNYRQNAQKKAAMANARQCLTAIAAFLAEDPNADPSGASVPSGCTPSGTDSCSCTVGSQSATCTVGAGGGVTCE